MNNRSAWIFGGAGYLGSAVTKALDEQYAKVICIDLPGRAEDVIKEYGLTRTKAAGLDVFDYEAVAEFLRRTVEEEGAPDGVVNLTFASTSGKRLHELSVEEFRSSVDRALTSAFLVCRDLGEAMKQKGGGSIVNFSSMYGLVSPDPEVYQPPLIPNPVDYGTGKAGIVQMTRYFAVHHGTVGVRYNAIAPGPFPNPKVQAEHPGFIEALSRKSPMKRIGTNEEIVAPVLFFLSEGASYVTGQTLAVDGGWTAW